MGKISFPPLKEEKGVVLVTALLIMLVLTLLGLGAILTSSLEIRTSGNERLIKSAFNLADAGVEIAPKIIRYYIQEKPDPAGYPNNLRNDIKAIVKDQYFFDEIMGYPGNDSSTDTPESNPPDIQINTEGKQANIDIDRVYEEYAAGGAVEFATGYEGGGSGGEGAGVVVYYRANSEGMESNNTRSNIEMVYRYVR